MSAFVIVSLMHLAPPHEDSSKCDDVTMISHSDDALTDYPKDTVGVVADCWIRTSNLLPLWSRSAKLS